MFGQVYANIDLSKQALDKDDLYPYLLPIWGKKVIEKGFQLPYSAGLGVNYMWQESDIVISDLMVGFNNGPMYDLDEVIRFDSSVSTSEGFNIRPDIWLLPFLNVYGVFAQSKSSTAIEAALWLPDADNNWTERVAFSSTANFDVTSMGFGLTPTMGVGNFWLALDMNFVWTDVSALEKPVFSFVFGPRLGKTIKLKGDKTVSFWAGAFRLKMSSDTVGSLNLSEVLPVDDLQAKVDQGLETVDEVQAQVDEWWNGLPPSEQQDPVNIAKYDAANRAIDAAGNLLTSIDGALSAADSATVQYSLTKKPKDMWNFVVGSQFQLSKHWMIRAEYGFLGSRQQFIAGIQYRFGL
jgi:hypothetical protein